MSPRRARAVPAVAVALGAVTAVACSPVPAPAPQPPADPPPAVTGALQQNRAQLESGEVSVLLTVPGPATCSPVARGEGPVPSSPWRGAPSRCACA